MIETGTLLQNRYLIERQIGAGGMGAVFLAVDQRFESYVAIKETFNKDHELAEAFEREARLLNSLHHPVLPHVSDYFTESNGHFLVMQFIEGDDLSAILKREGAFPVEKVIGWTRNLLDALDYLHSQDPPVIHRDIKPQNLKITGRGEIILLDFGLAKLNSDDNSGALSVFGYSRKYSPLEQIQGTGTDARSDIFALGATVYHLLTGKPPIDVLSRAAEIVAGNPDPLRLASEINNEIPIGFAQLLNSALALNPAQRFVSAKAMEQALEHAINPGSTEIKEDLPEELLPVIAGVDTQAINSVETEDFPALESFVEEIKNSPLTTNESEKIEAADNEIADPVKPWVSPKIPSLPAQWNIEAQKNGSRSNKSWSGVAILMAILVCAGLAVWYNVNAVGSAVESSRTSTEQTIPVENSDAELPPPVANLPSPETSVENKEESEILPPEKETIADKRKPAEVSSGKAEPTEKAKSVSAAPPVATRSEPAKTTQSAIERPRRASPAPSRTINSEPVPDIESVFTGRPSWRRQERQRRQRQGQAVESDEQEELRRQRREARRQRRNRNPIPF